MNNKDHLIVAHHVDALLGDDRLKLADLLQRELVLTLQLLDNLHSCLFVFGILFRCASIP